MLTALAAVPKGIPDINRSRSYLHLLKNQYGAVNMAAYTDEQWRATGLPYCRECMSSPAQVAFHSEPYWDQLNGYWSVEPCPHGHIMTPERVAAQIEAKKRWDVIWTGCLFIIAFAFGLEFGHWGWLAILIFLGVAVAAFRSYRKKGYVVINVLQHHPEIYGYWERNKRGNQPWLGR